MAKDYLSIEEASSELGISESRIKALVAEGKVREYRDAGKVFFKRAELEDAEKGGSSIVDLNADGNSPDDVSLDDNESFASALSSLADSSMALGTLDDSPAPLSGLPSMGEDTAEISFGDEEPETAKSKGGQASSGFDLADMPDELPAEEVPGEGTFTSEIDLLPDDGEKSHAGSAPAPRPEPAALDEIPDLGLSGSSIISLEPSDSQVSKSPKKAAKEDTHTMSPGISVFDDEEMEIETDPLGETQISSGVGDFDAIGGGSGLLDLTQESDDTSLGAELLDVISPTDATEIEVDALEADTITEDVQVGTFEDDHAIGASGGASMASAAGVGMAARRAQSGVMPGATPLNVTMLLGILGMAMLGLAAAGSIQGVWPATVMDAISNGVVHWSVFGGAILVAIVLGIVGILAGRK